MGDLFEAQRTCPDKMDVSRKNIEGKNSFVDLTQHLEEKSNNCESNGLETKTGHNSLLPTKRVDCAPLTSLCMKCMKLFLASSHPLPEKPSTIRRIGQMFLFPPSGKVAAILFVAFMFAGVWATLISIINKEALPGSNLYPIIILFIGAWCGGYIIKPTSLPPLLGMLIVGIILRNVPGINIATQINSYWSSTARSMALAVILIKAGLGLDPVALRRLSFVVPRLAFCPSIAEVVVDGIAARFILDMPWTWSFMLA